MFNFFVKNKAGLTVVIVIILGIFIYGYFFKGTPSTETIAQPLTGEQLLDSLDTLRNINIDDTLLKSDTFSKLEDYTTQVVSQPRGRTNPFAPIGVQ